MQETPTSCGAASLAVKKISSMGNPHLLRETASKRAEMREPAIKGSCLPRRKNGISEKTEESRVAALEERR